MVGTKGTPLLHVRRLKPREVQKFGKGHTAPEWHRQNSNGGQSVFRARVLDHYAVLPFSQTTLRPPLLSSEDEETEVPNS